MPDGENPFDRFKIIQKNAPNRLKLTARQVRALEEVDLGGRGPTAPLVAQVRDYFLFSFYAAGARFTDVALMRRSNVRMEEADDRRDVYVSYVMGKTGKAQAVRVDPKAIPIVEAFLAWEAADDDPFLFPMLDKARYDVDDPEGLVSASNSQNVVVNKYLKRVAAAVEDQLGVPMPHTTFHAARHSWADLARRSGRDLYEIRNAMKHSTLSVTEFYFASGEGEVIDAEI